MSSETVRGVLAGYAASATPDLIAAYDMLEPERIYAQVLDLFPRPGARIADIGAGTGRDAAWLAARGHRVVAVEPVRELREAGEALHCAEAVEWLDDRLPDVPELLRSGQFDAVLLCAVWHHLDASDRTVALPKLAAALVDGGRLIMSLRHEPGPPDRASFAVSADATIQAAGACGLRLLRRREAESVSEESRVSGVRWTWLAFEKV